MTSVRSVDHVQLPVPVGGSKEARVFYEELLGLREVRDPAHDRPGSLHYALGWGRLDLREGMYSGVAPQAHLALRVDGLAAITQRLRRAAPASSSTRRRCSTPAASTSSTRSATGSS
jgi:catechol 2,3-dioxygenase-like lactoylglutathione lyase family enzyme